MALLEVKQLSKAFGGVTAVDRLSFGVEKGTITALIGPNGAGKSTVLNLISQLEPADQGFVFFASRDISQTGPHKLAHLGIGRTFQNLELFDSLTVRDNLLAARQAARPFNPIADLVFPLLSRKEERRDRRSVAEVMALLDLEHLAKHPAGSLAYGDKKRLELGRALCCDARLLLLDEPAAGLSPEEVDQMAFWIHHLRSQKDVTVLFIDHDMALVSALADRVVVMDQGRLFRQGPTADVLQDPTVQALYMGEAPSC